jgi:hypothetical protein
VADDAALPDGCDLGGFVHELLELRCHRAWRALAEPFLRASRTPLRAVRVTAIAPDVIAAAPRGVSAHVRELRAMRYGSPRD